MTYGNMAVRTFCNPLFNSWWCHMSLQNWVVIDSGNALPPLQRQAITWPDADLSSVAGGNHDDVINGKYFPRYWPFVRGIHRVPVNSPHKDQWRGALMFSLICLWTNGWVHDRDAGDLRRNRTHCDVAVMCSLKFESKSTAFSQKRAVENIRSKSVQYKDHGNKKTQNTSIYNPNNGNTTRNVMINLFQWNSYCSSNNNFYYSDVIMGSIASQITSLTIVYSIVYSDTDERKHQSSASLALWGEFTGGRWIPSTKGQ